MRGLDQVLYALIVKVLVYFWLILSKNVKILTIADVNNNTKRLTVERWIKGTVAEGSSPRHDSNTEDLLRKVG